MKYLMIQNPGICPVEGFTVLGVSLTRAAEVEGTIGQFGSGSKHSTNLLLRQKIVPVVFCSNLRLDFSTEKKVVKDGLSENEYQQVLVNFSGKDNENKQVKRKQELPYSVEYGVQDWTETAMALREYVSNAIDRTIREEKGFETAIAEERLVIKIVEENQVRAKSGFTRVFVPLEIDVERFYDQLHRRFLHFREPESLGKKILKKRRRGIANEESVMIYRDGVLVCEITSAKSIFDYNFGKELRLDECRNVEDHVVRSQAAQAIRSAPPEILKEFFEHAIANDSMWELSLDQYYLSPGNIWQEEEKKQAQENWTEGFKQAAGDAVVCSKESGLAESVQRKGCKVAVLNNTSIVRAIENTNIPVAARVLSHFEKNGMEIIDANETSIDAVNTVWAWIEKANMTNSKTKPPVKGFREIMKGESETLGFYRDGTVYFNEYYSKGGVTLQLLGTALEEVGHYITGATDNSRDFQNFFIQLNVNLMMK